MFTFRKSISVVALLAITLVACTPEDGETGPIGPVGPEGPIGPAGAGEDGKDGVANISVFTFNVLETDWRQPTMNSAFKRDTLSVPSLTQNVLDNGTVQAFQTFTAVSDSLRWNPFPYRYLTLNTAGTSVSVMNLQTSYDLGVVYLNSFTDDRFLADIPDMRIKIVIIPPAAKIAGLDPKSYEEVKMVYGLED